MDFEKIKSILATKTVGIAGCGGLGSNCAVSLARVGIGRLIIADFDVVSESNLNRQYFFRDQIGREKALALKENIARITSETRVDAHVVKLDSKNIPLFFNECDVVIEAFDLAEMKEMIIETVLSEMPDKYLVCGIGLAGWGSNNTIHTRQLGKLFICGDETNETSNDLLPLGPRVAIVANMQANQVMEILLGKIID